MEKKKSILAGSLLTGAIVAFSSFSAIAQKISGQFKSTNSANVFAILRSVIDTTIKSGQNVLNALFLIATFGTE